jgi:hypothetical protein
MFLNIVKEVQNVLFCDNCYPEETRQTLKEYEFEYNDILYNEVSKLLTEFISSRNADIFLSKFYSSIVLYAHYYIFNLDKRLCALLALHIGNHILSFYKKQLNSPYEESKEKPISAQELDGLQYLAGYVIHKFIKKTRNNKNFNSKINQDTMAILKKFTADIFVDQKLICSQNRGGLTAVTKECQCIFIVAESLFRRETSKSNFKKIDIDKMVNSLMEDTEIISLYSNIIETFETENFVAFDSDLANNILENMLKLYLRVRSFSLTRDIVQLHKEKKKEKSLHKTIKKASQKLCIQE